jgi:predicted dehydrogenase
MLTNPRRVALVGSGAMGREHARAFSAIENVRVTGIYNRSRMKAEALARELGEMEVYDDIEALYVQSRADLVVIAVPELSIASVIDACLRFPWAILMEKPVGYNVADGEAIAARAKEAGARVMVGLNRRFLSSTRAALDDLRDDPGRRFIHVQDQQSLESARAVGQPEEVVRNWMYANSIHLVDYLPLFGRGTAVEVERIAPWRPDSPGVVLAALRFSSGDLGLYEAIWHGPGPWACTITTSRRRWEMRPLEQAAFQNAGERKVQQIGPDPWDYEFKPGFRRQAEEVIAALDGRPSAVPDIAEAMRTMRLIRDIYTG